MEIYLDNAATTKACEAAVSAVTECLINNYGNPSSLHKKGLDAESAMNKSRKSISDALGCDSEEIIFTSCATESTNMALKSVAQKYGKRKKTIITSSVEHSSVKEMMKYFSENGYTVRYVDPRGDGKFYAEDFISAVDGNTFLISMMLVNNENGCILPVGDVFKKIKAKYKDDIICHCDAVQGFMKIPFRVKNLHCDLLSLSAHKIYAPKGIGALYIRKGIIIHPLLLGGGQEKKIRSGTESVPLIAGFGAAVDFLTSQTEKNLEHYKDLKSYLTEKLSELENIKINSPICDEYAPYIVNFSVMNIRSEIMLHYLEKRNIYVSSGSACSRGKDSGVLENFGADRETADSAIRVSFSFETKKEDLGKLIKAISDGQKDICKR